MHRHLYTIWADCGRVFAIVLLVIVSAMGWRIIILPQNTHTHAIHAHAQRMRCVAVVYDPTNDVITSAHVCFWSRGAWMAEGWRGENTQSHTITYYTAGYLSARTYRLCVNGMHGKQHGRSETCHLRQQHRAQSAN